MKLKFLAAACAITFSGSAFAIAPTVTPDAALYISGASAQLNTIEGIAESLFQAGTIDEYTDQANGAHGVGYRAYYGKLKAGVAPAVGGARNVLIVERAAGGSYQGVGPLARAQAIGFLNVSAANCTATGNAFPNPAYRCAASPLVNQVPDLGVSDTEPALFVSPNLPAGQQAIGATELGNITTQSQYHVIMGIAASKNFPANSLSRAQIAAILSGSVTNWDAFGLGDKPVVLQTRVPGSGTKTASNAYFLNAPCGGALGASLEPVGAQGDPINFSSYTVVENSSAGNVVAGLNNANAKGAWAIGIASRELNPSASDGWKWLQIGGVDGTVSNVVSGAYDYFVTQSLQYRNTTVNGVPAPSGAKLQLINAVISASTNPALVTTLPGVALDPTITDPSSNPAYMNFITKGTRLGNSCAPLQLQEF